MFEPDYAVIINSLYRKFPTYTDRPTMFTFLQRLWSHDKKSFKPFFALQDINITITKGDKIGLIGNNGAGKTTLLKTIARLLMPTNGSVKINGEIIFLSGLGIGMVDELSVQENIFLYGAIYGIERHRLRTILHELLEWAGLENFVHAKLKTLSTGMRARLAFSIIRYIEANIFLLDEVLSAGDISFQQKCKDFFHRPINEDKTFILSTHDLDFLLSFCQKTLWLHKGQIVAFGDTETIIEEYRKENKR